MDWFDAFVKQFAVYGYPVLFIGVLLENAGIPVPGETAVLVAGFLSSPAGGSHFNVIWVILITLTAAVIGDNVGFWLGHTWARQRLRQGRWFLFLTPKSLQLAEGYFNRYGVWTIFFARFITGLRVIGALAAGTAGMPWPRFLIANAGGALAWSVTMSLLGYFFGHSWELLHRWLGRGALIILGCVVVLMGLPFLLRRLHQLPVVWDRLARAQIWRGALVAVLEMICIGTLALLARRDHPTRLDRAIADWINGHSAPALDALATVGSYAGGLPVVAGVALGLIAQLWYRGRSWREHAVVIWSVAASEAAGLLLIALLHFQEVDYARANAWPFGFAGLIPLRAFAVIGMAVQVLARQDPRWGRAAQVLAALLILLAGFGVVWSNRQVLSEALVGYAAGGLILFAGLWWLEGYGPGLVSPPGERESTSSHARLAESPVPQAETRGPLPRR
jgi:membrane-associated protein